ncbi:RabGAP/TBC [Martensiomyces pterosporus]|nr:RabGAP/TBC [Martensiomyces pterosporus]
MDELDAVTGAWESAMTQLPDGDFWLSVVSDLSGLQKRAPLHLAAKIRAGIPPRIRGVVWQTLTKARSTYLQTVYTQLIKEYSPHERIIRRDLTRTFPKIPVFKREGGEGQQRLFRILKAYSLYDAEVGYCQGLGFIIGPLMMSMGECEAFCVLVRLMETYDLRGMFTEDMAGLHLRLYQFQILAAEIIPDVMAHLEAHGVLPAMYVPAWFLSLFAYTMPLSFVLRAMDVLMAEGAPESIMRIGISLLRRNAESILRQEDFECTAIAEWASQVEDQQLGQEPDDAILLGQRQQGRVRCGGIR